MRILKLAVTAALVLPATLAWCFPATVEKTVNDDLLIRWDASGRSVDVWVEYRTTDQKPLRQLVSRQDSDGQYLLPAKSERPYIFLVTADGKQQALAQRLLPLQAGNNFRDLGGYAATKGSSVKWGMLYRSGTMVDLTSNDYHYLDSLGIRVVCDFRSSEERVNEPTRWQGSSTPQRKETDYVLDMNILGAGLARPNLSPAQARQVFADFYREIPFTFAMQYKQMFAELLAGHAPLAFNCSAGKDRTGVAAALLLRALGVSHADIVADYLLSNQYYQPRPSKPGANDATSRMLASLPAEVLKVLMGVDAQYVDAAFAAIEERHGSFENYMSTMLGIDAAGMQKLRELYTE